MGKLLYYVVVFLLERILYIRQFGIRRNFAVVGFQLLLYQKRSNAIDLSVKVTTRVHSFGPTTIRRAMSLYSEQSAYVNINWP